jgi:hypothetical protein
MTNSFIGKKKMTNLILFFFFKKWHVLLLMLKKSEGIHLENKGTRPSYTLSQKDLL